MSETFVLNTLNKSTSSDMDSKDIMLEILHELKKMNLYLMSISGEEITDKEILE